MPTFLAEILNTLDSYDHCDDIGLSSESYVRHKALKVSLKGEFDVSLR